MDDDDLPGTPCCPECGTMLEVAGTERFPFWWCPNCKVARVNV